MVREELGRLSVPTVSFNQREFESTGVSFEVGSGGRVSGWLTLKDRRLRLEDFTGVYLRMMDDSKLPELEEEPPISPLRDHCRAVHQALMHWCAVTTARVVNRLEPMGSNCSKPYQAQLIMEQGFSTPETLITNDPEEALAFYERHGDVIYKSMSGVRSIVHKLEPSDLDRLHEIRWCPVQFQECLGGSDMRVHTVGDEVFATAIETSATDYRYATQQVDQSATLSALTLSDDLAEACVGLAKGLGLAFAGIDLRVLEDGRVYCFEVNPCPAFSYYQGHTGQPIAASVARYLAGVN